MKQCPLTTEDMQYMSKVPYSSVVGFLIYDMVCTRPDLAYAAILISRFMSNPDKEHWHAMKWVLRYVKGTVNHGLLYKKSKSVDNQLTGFCDSDYYGDLDRRRSLTGYRFMLFGNVVSWKASLQAVFELSTTEAEFMTITEAAKEAPWLQGLIGEFGVKQVTYPFQVVVKVQFTLPRTRGIMRNQSILIYGFTSLEIW